MKTHIPLASVFLMLLLSPWPTSAVAQSGRSLSPGLQSRIDPIESSCPTFSWIPDPRSFGLELLVYRLPEGIAPTGFEVSEDLKLFEISLPASASSWTPTLEHCLQPGHSYAWFIHGIESREDLGPPRFLSVPKLPSPGEITALLSAIPTTSTAEGTRNTLPTGSTSMDRSRKQSDFRKSKRSRFTAPAAIRAENATASSSEVYGLTGSSLAEDGAGIAAANLNGGPDLRIDGAEEGAADASLWEWGMERHSDSNATFSFRNTDSGSFTLDVEGEVLTDSMDCPACIGPDVLANDSVGASEIAPGVVTHGKLGVAGVFEEDLASSAVGNVAIADHAVTAIKLRTASVTGNEIADGTIDWNDIAPLGGVYASKASLYQRSAIGYLTNDTGTLSVICTDENDLPLQGSCKVEDPLSMALITESASHWNSDTEAGTFSCTAKKTGPGTSSYEAFIVCIEVAGP